jgi:hypothetical protein
VAEIARALRDLRAVLYRANGRCRERTLDLWDALAHLQRAVRLGQSATDPVRLPGAYRYRYTWTGFRAWVEEGKLMYACTRVPCQATIEERASDGACHPIVGLLPHLLDGCVQGDAFSLPSAARRIRYDADGRVTGIAVPMPRDLRRRWGRWEHGRDEAECSREIGAKRAILDEEEAERRQQRQRQRAARLVLRLAPNAEVRYEDARSVGACDAGIRGWAATHGITDLSATVPLSLVARNEPVWGLRLARHIWLTRRAQSSTAPA